MKPVLVGEYNPYGSNPRFALFPNPRSSAGGRLCYDIFGMNAAEYLRSFDRMNLLEIAKWSASLARSRAASLLTDNPGRTFILLGSNVCKAFGFEFKPFSSDARLVPPGRIIRLPHPSGRCLLWNAPDAAETARRLVAEVIEK